VIHLSSHEPVAVTDMAATAPSRQLPEFAANFRPDPGRSFAKTISRDAPPGDDGASRYWVQPKDLGGLFPGQEAPPAPFMMKAPRGSGPAKQMHEPPTQLLTPAERREALRPVEGDPHHPLGPELAVRAEALLQRTSGGTAAPDME